MKKAVVLALSAFCLAACKDKGTVAPDAPVQEKDTLSADSAGMASIDRSSRLLALNAPSAAVFQEGYASFGAKISPAKALTKEQMFKKYAGLKKGDTLQVKFKSRIHAVCKKKGCWMTLDLKDEERAFVKFKDYEFFVPLNADGSDAIVSGKAFVSIESVAEQKHYAKDGGKSQAEIDKITKPKRTYGFMADGVLIAK